MPWTHLPFLYQTRSLQRLFRGSALGVSTPLRFASGSSRHSTASESVPFEWDEDASQAELQDDATHSSQASSITPAEAAAFRRIFDEIATGKLTGSIGQPEQQNVHQFDLEKDPIGAAIATKAHGSHSLSGSMVEQARMKEFRESTLQRFPGSLRAAAQVALGQYDSEPDDTSLENTGQLNDSARKNWERSMLYTKMRVKERARVDHLMNQCSTDVELWKVMEREVFSLPAKLGISSGSEKPNSQKQQKKNSRELSMDAGHEDHAMDVYGPLYSHFVVVGLELFNKAFTRPSPYVFKILPRIKEAGLPSYVLGVSTPLYSKLAWIYWKRFGDLTSVLDLLHEMVSSGLYADQQAVVLLRRIREDVDSCASGLRGSFVKAVVKSWPYDEASKKRLRDMEEYAEHSWRTALAANS